ncbi:MAG TPA: response regulator [Thermoanaerobaculia bacterium]|jgi:CheY-like chemotaxis protein
MIVSPLLLPREEPPAAEVPAVVETAHRILVADDDPAILRLFAALAKRERLACDCAANGVEAVAALRQQDYSLIFLDLMMPRVDGWGVLDYLRTHAKEDMPSVFVVTAFLDQMVSNADRQIVTGILYKPVDGDDVAALMRACARGGSAIGVMQRTRHRLIGAPV